MVVFSEVSRGLDIVAVIVGAVVMQTIMSELLDCNFPISVAEYTQAILQLCAWGGTI